MASFNPFSLDNKRILVTGASSGIGRSVAIECSKQGAKIYATGRNKKELSNTLDSLDGSGHNIIQADITNEAELENLVSSLIPLNGLVYSAGISNRLPLKFIKRGKLDELHKINFIAPLFLSQKLYRSKLLAKESSLVFISSVAVNYASKGSIMYMSSKGALNSFVKGLAFELSTFGIRANIIQPGMINTNLSPLLSNQDKEKDIANYPLGRYGNPEEIAYAAVYLLSDATKWITGSTLTIDGGLTLR